MGTFGFTQFLGRWLFAAVLVLATYNPSGWSFVDWLRKDDLANLAPLKALCALLLVAGYSLFVSATWRSLGFWGTALTAAILATLAWLLVYYGWLDLDNSTLLTWTALVIFATVLAVGMSWSHVSRRASGQLDIDDTDD